MNGKRINYTELARNYLRRLEKTNKINTLTDAKIIKYLDWATPHDPLRCLRHHYFALAVKDDTVLLPSYNGSPRCSANCTDINLCNKDLFKIPIGDSKTPHTGDEFCPAVHAEANVICAAARLGISLDGAFLFISGINPDGTIPDCTPCYGCAKLIRQSGFGLVICNKPDDIFVATPNDLKIIMKIHSEIIEKNPFLTF